MPFKSIAVDTECPQMSQKCVMLRLDLYWPQQLTKIGLVRLIINNKINLCKILSASLYLSCYYVNYNKFIRFGFHLHFFLLSKIYWKCYLTYVIPVCHKLFLLHNQRH